jgi:hypothetical protein
LPRDLCAGRILSLSLLIAVLRTYPEKAAPTLLALVPAHALKALRLLALVFDRTTDRSFRFEMPEFSMHPFGFEQTER